MKTYFVLLALLVAVMTTGVSASVQIVDASPVVHPSSNVTIGGVLNAVTRSINVVKSNATFGPKSLPVPEPATWAYVVSGFGLLLMITRWRRSA